jgi:hypothetical protein
MKMSSTVIRFLSRRELAERDDAAAIDLDDAAQDEALKAIARVLARVDRPRHGVALRAALHDVLARLHERGEFDNGEILGQIEEIARAAIPNLRAPVY